MGNINTITKIIEKELADAEKLLDAMDCPADEQTPEFQDGYVAGLKFAARTIRDNSLYMTIQTAIHQFVKNNYGQAEVDAPSWDIGALTKAVHTAINQENKGE